MPFGILVEVKALHSVSLSYSRILGTFGEGVTTSRTFSGGALMTMDVCSVALNQDIIDEVLWQECGEAQSAPMYSQASLGRFAS